MSPLTSYVQHVGQPFRAASAGRRFRCALATVIGILLAATQVFAATRYDPVLRFRSITTPHFVILYHQGEESLARRLAAIAEDVHTALTMRMGRETGERTHVVIVDQTDEPNGWATPLPYNLIEISAAPPSGASLIGRTSDWLRLVFTHEYAHILHLDRSRGWAGTARAVFGRVALAFPNLSLPLWQIEGLATFEESDGGEGRLHAGDFHAIVREAARAGRFEPIDRVGGGLTDWPGAHGWYAYGGFFHAFLAERYGRARLAELSERTAGRAPYLTAGAFEAVFGRSLGDLWREFREAERAAAPAGAAAPGVTRLTFTGHIARGPRFDSEGGILYSRSDPHGLPSLERISLDGTARARLTSRIGGEHVTASDDAVYFDQLELERSVAATSDLYRLDRRTLEVTRLTHGARVADPDLSPDGRRFAAVVSGGGRRDLVILPRAAIEARPAAPPRTGRDPVPAGNGIAGVFARPRWSPDGRLLAVEARGLAGISSIAVLDPASGQRTLEIASPGRNIAPAWAPDGRSIVFASDRDGGPLDLYRAWLSADAGAVEALERLTRLPGGAHSPDVAPDGRSAVFVGYTADGYDLFTIALSDSPGGESAAELKFGPTGGTAAELKFGPTGGTAAGLKFDPAGADAAYSPWATLRPRAWLPTVALDDDQVELGAVVTAVDALGYHAWTAAAAWPVARRADFAGLPGRARPDVRLAYVYDRWRPTLFAQAEDDTTPLLVRPGTSADPRALLVRDRSASVGLALPFRRMLRAQTVTAAWHFEHRTIVTAPGEVTETRGSFRAGWALSTARRYGYSISPEGGVSAGIALEASRRALGADVDSTFTRADVRAFLPVVPRRGVLAMRASAGAARGDPRGRRTARLGGGDGDPGVLSFDEGASSLLRGFPANAFQGHTVALLNTEYRVPLAWPERGLGAWPLFVRSLHATVFSDVGHAWSGRFRASDVKSSWGAELSADMTAGYVLPLTWSAGIAWGRDHSGGVPDNRRVYVRLGHGF